ncbi:MAG: helix-turn-helix domain-containing protein [Alistipes sp.]|nr:helix-turn-helix domain-containing protein [Alistipes sp.]
MRLKELRESRGESQQSLALKVNSSQAMISRFELGISYPDVQTVIALSKHYGVSTDYLLGVSDVKLPYTKSDLSEKEQNLLFLFKKLTSTQKEKATAYIEGMLDK